MTVWTQMFRTIISCGAIVCAGFAEAGEADDDALTFREVHTVLETLFLDRPIAVAVAPDGNDVYVAALDAGGITQMQRNADDGTLTPWTYPDLFVYARLESDGDLFFPVNLLVSPNDAFVYVSVVDAGLSRAGVARYNRDANGVLSFGAGLPADEDQVIQGLHAPIGMVQSPDGRHLYVLNDFYVDPPFYNTAIGVVATDPDTGTMSFVQLIDLPEFSRDRISDIAISPDGQNVYVSRASREEIDIYSRNATTGSLTFLESADLGGDSGIVAVYSIAVSPDGAHVYAMTTYQGGTLELLDRAVDGSLSLRPDDSIELDGPVRVGVSPDGERVYATSVTDDPLTRVSAYARDPDTGELTLIEAITDGIVGINLLDSPGEFAVSPDSEHLYIPAGSFFSAVAVFVKDRPELPCEDFDAIDAEYEALVDAYSFPEDLDLDDLPEAASLALLEAAACANLQYDGFDEAITNAYLINRASIAGENEVVFTDDWDGYQHALASLRMISSVMGVYLNEAFKPFDVDIDDEYIAVTCADGLCEPANARNADEPLSGEGDPDDDGFTNAEEWANVVAGGGTVDDFARAALDPLNDGSLGLGGDDDDGGGCFIATAAYGTPLAAELDTLRGVRDSRLLTNPLGAAFVDAYYRLSPPAANFIAERPEWRAMARFGIESLLNKYTTVVGVGLFGVLFALIARRQRRNAQRN